MLRYIDVSTHQGVIDWDKVKASGQVDGVFIRAGYGQNNIDAQFKRNASECNRLGIPLGVYWFSYAYTADMAKREAAYCLEAIKPYRIELPVCFDFEGDSARYAASNSVKISKPIVSTMVDCFCGSVEDAGYYAMNYGNLDYIRNYFGSDIMEKYDLWLAWYSGNPEQIDRPYGAGIWQYTSSGKVEGINGNVDINAVYRDYVKIIRNAGLNHLKTEYKTYPDGDGEIYEPVTAEAEGKPWYSEAQEWAVKNGIADGTRPEEACTRAEVWTMLKRLKEGQ